MKSARNGSADGKRVGMNADRFGLGDALMEATSFARPLLERVRLDDRENRCTVRVRRRFFAGVARSRRETDNMSDKR